MAQAVYLGYFDECEGETKNMLLETKRLIIRSILPTDEKAFINMAACGKFMGIAANVIYG